MKWTYKRWWLWLVMPVVVGVLALLMVCSTYRIWSVKQWEVYQAMEQECHPAWRDFHFGRIRAGESVEEVITKTEPTKVKRTGRWVILDYYPDEEGDGLRFTGLTAVAYDGQMVFACAYSCAWTRLFFDELSEDQCLEYFGRSRDDPRRLGIAPVYR